MYKRPYVVLGLLKPFISLFSFFFGLGPCLPAFIQVTFITIIGLIPSLGLSAKWRSVFYWILTSTLDLDWLCPDLIIVDLSDQSCPPSLVTRKIGFLMLTSLTEVSPPPSSLFLIFILSWDFHLPGL